MGDYPQVTDPTPPPTPPTADAPSAPVRVPFPADDIAAHSEHDHLAGIFPHRDHAAAAIGELRSLGLGSDHLGVALYSDDPIVFEHDDEKELARDTAIGAAAGMAALVALTLPGLGFLALGGTLAVAGAAAVWGAVLGGYAGALKADVGWTEHQDMSYTALRPGEVMVVVCSHGHGDAVRDVIVRHGGRLHTVEPVAG